jgi:BMFP domain-containing protein YqiC
MRRFRGLQDVRKGSKEQEVVASGLAAEKASLGARIAALEARLATVASERDLARRSEKGLRWRVDMLESKLTSLRSTAGTETSRLSLTLHVSAGSSVHAWIQKNPSEAMNASASSSGMITGPKSPGAPQASRRHHST